MLAVVHILLLVSGGVALQGLPADPRGTPVHLPDVIIDPEAQVAYLTNQGRSVVAIDAADGRVLWEYPAASKPLALVDDGLAVVRADGAQLRVVLLDASNGTPIRECEPIALPQGVQIGDCLDQSKEGRSFWVRARWVEGRLLVRWLVERSYWGGARPSPEILEAIEGHTSKTVAIDLATGEIEAVPDDETLGQYDDCQLVAQWPAAELEVAKRQGWWFGRVIGDRAYGVAKESLYDYGRDFAWVEVVQAVDLATGKLLWKRPVREVFLGPPPP